MPPGLKRKVGPLPVWGWVLVAGGTIGAVILVKRSRAATKAPQGEAVPEHLSVPGIESGGASGAGGEAKTPAPEAPAPVTTPAPTSPTYEIGGFPGEVRDVTEGVNALRDAGFIPGAPAPGASSSPAGAPAAARHRATGGNPRHGLTFRPTTYHGHAAHEYPRSVPGGIGPGHRFVLLPVGRKNHAAKGKHEPHHAKPKPAHHAQPPHRPTVHHAPVHHAPPVHHRRHR